MTLLLLAGTQEAKRIAWGLSDSGIPVLASLAGATRSPEPMPVPTRIGGFGGEDAFREVLATHDIHGVLDATHPFADQITDRTFRVCTEIGLPYAQVVRPPWEPATEDTWIPIRQPEEAAAHIPQDAVVFLGTGRQTLTRYQNLEGRRVLVRVVDPPMAPLPFDGGEFVIGRPPFTVSSEETLFKGLGVTHLVVKNAGGSGGRAKLDAARHLGICVLMLDRPDMAQGTQLTSVQAALEWVKNL